MVRQDGGRCVGRIGEFVMGSRGKDFGIVGMKERRCGEGENGDREGWGWREGLKSRNFLNAVCHRRREGLKIDGRVDGREEYEKVERHRKLR
jgi:hypothetical protein